MPHPPVQLTAPLGPTSPLGDRRRIATPWRDPILWVGVVVWVLSVLPSLVPLLPPEVAFAWADGFADVPIFIVTVVALAVCIHRAEEGEERVFWVLVMASPLTSIVARILFQVVPWGDNGVLLDQTTDLTYLVGYTGMILALELRPVAPDRRPPPARRVERLGIVLFALFLLSYFTLGPSVFRPELYATWVPSMLLFSVMDAYLLARTWWILRDGVDASWKAPFRWLRWLFVLGLVGDVTEGFMYLGTIPYIDSGTPADILWDLPGLVLLAATRSRLWTSGREGNG